MFVAPPGYQPVYSPRIPYLGPIYGGLRDGSSIYLQGSTPENMTRFFVNLLCGESESSDVALHFNPRFDGWDKVVFNTRRNNSWDSEDKVRSMPFSRGRAFELLILVTSRGYQVKVDGKEFHTFAHRLPVEGVRAMHIAGDVSIQTINVIGGAGGGSGQHPGGTAGGMGGNMGQGPFPGGCSGGGFQGGYPGGTAGGMGPGGYPAGNMGQCGYPGGLAGGTAGGYPGSHLPSMGGQPVYNPPVPYSSMIPGGMFPKRTIIIRGMVSHGAKGLSINFKVSRTRDVAFHMNPRVQQGVVVRNSLMGGRWGQEERQLGASPFTQGQYFDMSIRCGNQRFKVFVNGQHLFDFFHRVQPFSEIDLLEIEGDVQISYIHF